MKIQAKVTPNSKIEQVSREGDKYLIRVKEPPKEGKANRAVIKLLAEYFKVPQQSVRIISGIGSKNKTIGIYSEPTNNNYNLDNGGYVGAKQHGSTK